MNTGDFLINLLVHEDQIAESTRFTNYFEKIFDTQRFFLIMDKAFRGVAQVVECLLGVQEVASSSLVTPTKRGGCN